MNKFSVVVVSSNGLEGTSRRELLANCLKSISKQNYSKGLFEVIIVDSGSNLGVDFVNSFVRDLKISIRYINPNLSNIGPARARNIGIREAAFDIVAFTDDDSTVPEDWLEQFSRVYRDFHEVVCVGGITLPEGTKSVSNIFAAYEKKLYLGYLKNGYLKEYFSDKVNEHPVFTGNISYKKGQLKDAGMFNESFPSFVSGEDGDLKERVMANGGKFVFVPVIVTHYCPYNLKRFVLQQLSRGASILKFRAEHFGKERFIYVFFKFIISFFWLPVILVRQNFDFKYSLISWLSLVIRNAGKIYYYEKI